MWSKHLSKIDSPSPLIEANVLFAAIDNDKACSIN